MRWNHYKLQQLSLLQSAMDSYYKLRQLFYYKVRHGLLQIATGITKCDDYYKLRQYNLPFCSPKNQVTPPPPPPTQAINNDRSLRVVNYICIIYFFVLAQGAPLSLSKRKVPQVPNEKQFKGIKCKRDLSVENNKQTKKKKTSTQAPVKKFCVRAGFKLNLCFW